MKIRSFQAFRPIADKAAQIASRPYDVLNSDEARVEAEDNALSFLNVVKPEISLPVDIDPYSESVYKAGKDNFQKLVDEGVFLQDAKPALYLYELIMNGRSQTGIVASASVNDYLEDKIKKHELTRPDKENDRKNHVRVSMMNAEPVFFAYRQVKELNDVIDSYKTKTPEYDFVAEDDVRHRFWVIDDEKIVDTIIQEFEKIPATYVADGHHRTAAAALVGNDLRQENKGHDGTEEYNYFLAVHFPDNQLEIIDYNRVVSDLNGLEPAEFLDKLSDSFTVTSNGKNQLKPQTLHEIGMYLAGEWYSLKANSDSYDNNDPVGVLDVTILTNEILSPILNIKDLRRDKRIEFVGGIRGLQELERRVDSGEMTVAFAMYPVSMQQLMDIADSGNIMPPKTTWFEPKLRSGLVVHSLED
jgi:uncharacterized protein (DUF1015 family)